MGKLASQNDVLDLLSIRTTTQSIEAIGVALDLATSVAGSILGTDFSLKTRLDRFKVESDAYNRLLQGREVQFFLQDGFLSDKPKVYASRLVVPKVSGSITVDRDDYLTQLEEGVVILTGVAVSGLRSLLVRYECGFKETNDVYQDVPQWLKTATVSSCIQVLRSHVLTSNKKDNITDMSNAMTRIMRTVLYSKVRPRYLGVFPMHSEVS